MKKAICKLRSISTYGQSKFHQTPKLNKELSADFEDRTWREKAHFNEQGRVFIPGTMFANSLREASKYLSIQVPGKGKSTYTKHFESGIMVLDNLELPIKKDELKSVTVFVPSDGRVGGGKRVIKHFPVVHEWTGDVTYHIIDDIITADIFEQVLKASGQLIGIGYFRPRNRGYYGRFEVDNIEWIAV
jgi:hypothetical protein